MTTYRWNTSAQAEAFDAGAAAILPFYVSVQDEILSLLAADRLADDGRTPAFVVDLGGGSGLAPARQTASSAVYFMSRFRPERVACVASGSSGQACFG